MSAWRPGPIPHTVFDQPCLDFVNSEFTDHKGGGTRFDRLRMAEWRRWFLDRWSFDAPVHMSDATLKRVEGGRSLVREALEAGSVPTDGRLRRLNQLLASSPAAWHLERGPGGTLTMALRPMVAGWDAVLAGVIASLAELAVSGDLRLVRRCGNPDCQFIFFDGSANRTRRWCDPALCGNLVKVRAFRAREHRKSGSATRARRRGAPAASAARR